MVVWGFTTSIHNFSLQKLLHTTIVGIAKKFNYITNWYIICPLSKTKAKVIVVWSFTKNIHIFCTTKTTIHYHSRHCKENSIRSQIDIKFVMFRSPGQNLWSFEVVLITYSNFSLQKVLYTSTIDVAKKIQFYLKSI